MKKIKRRPAITGGVRKHLLTRITRFDSASVYAKLYRKPPNDRHHYQARGEAMKIKGRKINAVWLHDESGVYTAGSNGIVSIDEIYKPGHMADVPFVRINFSCGKTLEVSQHAVFVERTPQK